MIAFGDTALSNAKVTLPIAAEPSGSAMIAGVVLPDEVADCFGEGLLNTLAVLGSSVFEMSNYIGRKMGGKHLCPQTTGIHVAGRRWAPLMTGAFVWHLPAERFARSSPC
jgi:hypothetical protein